MSSKENNMEFIRHHTDIFDIKRIKKTFNRALRENGFEIRDLYDEYFNKLSKALSEDKLLLPTHIQDKELERLLKIFTIRKGNEFKTVTYISPNTDLWSRSDTSQFRAMIIRKLEEGLYEDELEDSDMDLAGDDVDDVIGEDIDAIIESILAEEEMEDEEEEKKDDKE